MTSNHKRFVSQIAALRRELDELPGIARPEIASSRGNCGLDAFVTDAELYRTIHKLFKDGHHAQAVERAYKFLNNLVKKVSGRKDLDGAGLMTEVFSPSKPILCLNDMSGRSYKDEQIGYMQIFQGVMTGIRNPRAHEHDWEDTEQRALELLTLANHLVLRVKACAVQNQNDV
jgi:uncharacterized protein (TIGR02391 family)